MDKTIKIWKISNDDIITHIKTLEGHNDSVCQVIPLTNNIIASGSWDKTIRIWDINAYKEIRLLKEDFSIYSLVKLKNKDVMASSGNGYNNSVSFWNESTLIKEYSVSCCNCFSFNGLIELPNHYLAVCGGESLSIDIIDTQKYQLIKQIECKDYIVNSDYLSSLRLLDDKTLIYSCGGSLCKISLTTYEILFKIKMEDEFIGYAITSSINGKYIISSNKKGGMSIFKLGK